MLRVMKQNISRGTVGEIQPLHDEAILSGMKYFDVAMSVLLNFRALVVAVRAARSRFDSLGAH